MNNVVEKIRGVDFVKPIINIFYSAEKTLSRQYLSKGVVG